jgi:UDP-N-acetylmuramate--alanine ligase
VFQPHRFTRTRDLFDDFAQLLSGIDHLIITEIYPAGEQVISGSDGRSLCRAIRKRGNDPVFVESLEELNTVLPNLTQNGDILLTLGAGDIGRFAQSLAGKSATAPEGDVHDG